MSQNIYFATSSIRKEKEVIINIDFPTILNTSKIRAFKMRFNKSFFDYGLMIPMLYQNIILFIPVCIQ